VGHARGGDPSGALTVLTVHEAVRGYYSGVAAFPDDPARTEEARQLA
jgi:hypothetical protein